MTCQLCLHLFLTLCFGTPTATVSPFLHSVCPSSMRAGATSSTEPLVMPFCSSTTDLPVPPFNLSLLLGAFNLRDQGERRGSFFVSSCRPRCSCATPSDAIASKGATASGEATASGGATNLVLPGETTVSGEATISGEATYRPCLLSCYP